MEDFLVISWWDKKQGSNIVPEVTSHTNKKMAEKESIWRKQTLGKNPRVILAKKIKEF